MLSAISFSDGWTSALLLWDLAIYQFEYGEYDLSLKTINSAFSKYEQESLKDYKFEQEKAFLHNMKGVVYYKQKRLLWALNEYFEALKFFEDSNDSFDGLIVQGIYSNMALLYTSSEQYYEASFLFQKIDECKNNSPSYGYLDNIWLNRAMTFYKMGKPDKALAFSSGRRFHPEYLKSLFENGMMYHTFITSTNLYLDIFISSPQEYKGESGVEVSSPIEISTLSTRSAYGIVTKLNQLTQIEYSIELPRSEPDPFISEETDTWLTRDVLTIIAITSGLSFLIIMLFIALLFRGPYTPFNQFVFRVILALAASGFGASLPGFFELDLPVLEKGLVHAGGALGLFILVYLINPPRFKEKRNK